MPSLLFPDGGSRRAEDTAGRPAVGKTAVVYADLAGTTLAEIYADAAGVPGAPIGDARLTTDAYGFLPTFWGPDSGTDRLYVSVNGGPVWPIDSDYNARLDGLALRVAAVELGGSGGGVDDTTVVHKAGTETITGVKTFTASPVVPTPVGSTDATHKGYVDTAVTAEAATRATADTTQAAAAQTVATNLATHQATTSAVHGIVSTAALETQAGAQAKADAAQTAATATATTALAAHVADTTSVHGVADMSILETQTGAQAKADAAAAASIPLTQKGAASGVATLGSDSKLTPAQVPTIAVVDYLGPVTDQAAMLALAGQQGDWTTRADTGTTWVITGADPTQLANWTELSYPAGAVVSVAGRTGAVALAGEDLTSGTVAYARLPIGATGSTVPAGNDARFTDARTPTVHATSHGSGGSDPVAVAQSQVTGLSTALTAKADAARSIVSGTGLTGGGDLTADRTLTVAYGTTSTTAARGDDTRITGAAQKASNLSDLASAATARTNLGLGNVTNTADADKPLSIAATTALAAKVDKDNLIINVKEHGVVGDGATDDTAAIQAIINTIPATGGVDLFFPAGRYRFSTLNLGERTITLTGVSPLMTTPARFGSSANATAGAFRGTWLVSTATTGAAITIGLAAGYARDYRYSLRNIGIVGPGAGTSLGILVEDVVGLKFDHVHIINFDVGIKTDLTQDSRFTDLLVWGCNTAIWMDGFSNQNVFFNTDLQYNTSYSIRMEETDTNLFSGGVTEVNSGTPIYLGTSCRKAVFDSWYFEDLQLDWPAPITWVVDCPGSENTFRDCRFKLHSQNCGDIRFTGNSNAVVSPYNPPSITLNGIANLLVGTFFNTVITEATAGANIIIAYQNVSLSSDVRLPSTKKLYLGTASTSGGAGSPEGVVTAVRGSQYWRTDGDANTTLYLKGSGTGNTGWSAAATANPLPSTTSVTVTGLTGAVTQSRFVGGTVSGPPVSGTFQANDYIISRDGNVYICTIAGTPGTWVTVGTPASLTALAADQPTVGEFVPRRERAFATNGVSVTSGTLVLTYFTADKTETINTVTAWSGGVAAAATPTLIRLGVYSVAGSGDLTLVASTANDTSLFAATNTAYAKALSAPFSKMVGQRYATALLLVSAVTTPTYHGFALTATSATSAAVRVAPAIVGRLLAQTDLPANIAAGSLAGFQSMVGMQLA